MAWGTKRLNSFTNKKSLKHFIKNKWNKSPLNDKIDEQIKNNISTHQNCIQIALEFMWYKFRQFGLYKSTILK